MATQTNAANWAQVPQVTGKSPEAAQPADKVHDFRDATPNLNREPLPGNDSKADGTDITSEESRNAGRTTSTKVIDHIDAPFKLNKDGVQSNP